MDQCPVTMYKTRRKWLGTRTHGEARILQGDGSEVSLSIPPGSQGVYMTRVHTDNTRFPHVVPSDECIISPLVEVEQTPNTTDFDASEPSNVPELMHTINIPHCLEDPDLWKYIIVRHGDVYKSRVFREIPTLAKSGKSYAYYEVNNRFITIHTTNFCQFVCTSCKRTCDAKIMLFVMGHLEHEDATDTFGPDEDIFVQQSVCD